MAGHSKAPSNITHISKARRLPYSRRPLTEPSCVVKELWASTVKEKNRAIIVEADLRVDMKIGDPGLRVLRKARYILENVREAFADEDATIEMVLFTVRAVRDYSEPEGEDILKLANHLFGHNKKVAQAVKEAAECLGVSKND
jgi:hypothetical protein